MLCMTPGNHAARRTSAASDALQMSLEAADNAARADDSCASSATHAGRPVWFRARARNPEILKPVRLKAVRLKAPGPAAATARGAAAAAGVRAGGGSVRGGAASGRVSSSFKLNEWYNKRVCGRPAVPEPRTKHEQEAQRPQPCRPPHRGRVLLIRLSSVTRQASVYSHGSRRGRAQELGR